MYRKFKYPGSGEPNQSSEDDNVNESVVKRTFVSQDTSSYTLCQKLPGTVPPPGSDLQVYLGASLRLVPVLTNEHPISSVACVNGELWAVLHNGTIQVLPVDGLRTRFIRVALRPSQSNSRELCVTALTQTQCGRIVVAAFRTNTAENSCAAQDPLAFLDSSLEGTGLFEIQHDGEILQNIAQGEYTDISCHGSLICGLKSTGEEASCPRSSLTIYKHDCTATVHEQWGLVKTVPLQPHRYMQCVLLHSHVILSARSLTHLHKYSLHDGNLQILNTDDNVKNTDAHHFGFDVNLYFADCMHCVLFSAATQGLLRLLHAEESIQTLSFEADGQSYDIQGAVMDNEGNVFLIVNHNTLCKFNFVV